MSFFGPNVSKLKKERDLEGLIKLLNHKNVKIRKEVAETLKDWGSAESVEGLRIALNDLNQGVRVYAVHGLAKIKTVDSESSLRLATKDADWEVRKEALCALVKSGSNIDVMVEAARFDSTELRDLAIARLGETGGSRAVLVLIEALQDEEELVRLRAVKGLARLKDPSAIEPLQKIIEDKDPQVSKAARSALIELGFRS